MKRPSGPAGFPLLGLVNASTLPPFVRPARQRVVVRGIDGTHMGVAVSWWRSLVTDDNDTLTAIRDTCPASDALRSGLEVVLAQASWLNRMQHGTAADESASGHGVAGVLSDLSLDSTLTDAHRDLCRELSSQLCRHPDGVDLSITPIPVSSLMGLVSFLGSTIEYRYRIPVTAQIAAYQRAVVLAEKLT